MKKNLRCLMNKFFILSMLFLSLRVQSAELQGYSSNNTINKVICDDKDDIYVCRITDYNEKYIFRVDKSKCFYLEARLLKDNTLWINCPAPRDTAAFYYYKKDNLKNDWLLFKYEYVSAPSDSYGEGYNYIIDTPYLFNLKRSLSKDFIDEPVLYGVIKGKTFLLDDNDEKTKKYLIKGDSVLVLGSKLYKNKTRYRIYYNGNKDVEAWVDSSYIEVIK
ncbi:hypothetical protein [Aggregatibacter actinomycetemcomitans]|uniref:hypothetical protein n=1 Tax=Aggregatibacter actinomycetemcomitans TaxID=714 RepID=UPI00197C551F|nr:hypothetical protein [Aggregatibacter actinomycetemcomitans]MBN6063398.1 hypothetical protein [Aggregatibacter actinomycetemcomitans]MBN6081097.1 hypothetical protein [Aggregatibacter actinomycetemcomitans]MBN6083276.1 hypothetical protein [Aggregatibacter actinomycetemcomitans]